MSDRYAELERYLNAMDGSCGCVPRYEEAVSGAWSGNYAWLSGHYRAQLDGLVQLIGRDVIRDLIYAERMRQAAIEEAVAKAEGRSDE